MQHEVTTVCVQYRAGFIHVHKVNTTEYVDVPLLVVEKEEITQCHPPVLVHQVQHAEAGRLTPTKHRHHLSQNVGGLALKKGGQGQMLADENGSRSVL